MKMDRLKWMLVTGLLGLLGFSSCTKPDPVPIMYGPPTYVCMYGPPLSSYQTHSQASSPGEQPTMTEAPELEIPEEE